MSEISRLSHLLQVDPRKVREYLLNPEHPEGETKARFFELLGFSREQP